MNPHYQSQFIGIQINTIVHLLRPLQKLTQILHVIVIHGYNQPLHQINTYHTISRCNMEHHHSQMLSNLAEYSYTTLMAIITLLKNFASVSCLFALFVAENPPSKLLYIKQTAPGMECGFNDLSNFPSASGYCSKWPSKVKYEALAIGAYEGRNEGITPQWSIFYVDFRDNIVSFPNQNHEAGIRPSCLVLFYCISNHL